MLYRTLLLLSLCVVAGCAPVSSPFIRYRAAYMQHPTEFTTTADSNALLWSRARTYVLERTTLATESDSTLQTPPPDVSGSPGITITRSVIGDSLTIRVIRMNHDYWGEEFKERETKPQSREAVHFIRTGLRQSDFAEPNQ